MKKTTNKRKDYTARDMRAVSDNPEWTKADFAKAKPFKKAFPRLRKIRGPKPSTRK